MIRDSADLFADDEAAMLADLAQLTPEPAALITLLPKLGYDPQLFGRGLYAPGLNSGPETPVLLFPLYTTAGLAVRQRQLVGRDVSRSGTLAAGLSALRSTDHRPPLLFLLDTQPLPDGIRPEQIVSLEGGVVPRIWRQCFGRVDALVRITGQRSHPGLSNVGVNAIESAIPVLQALLHLKSDIELRTARRESFSDAPLQPRLTINAAHAGSHGTVLPTIFDVLVSRRYEPGETMETALEEITAVVFGAASGPIKVEIAVTDHQEPVPDPDRANRSREERALAAGWGWPQVPFCTSPRLIPGATILGGLERPDYDGESDDASTTLDEMTAVSRTIRALLLHA